MLSLEERIDLIEWYFEIKNDKSVKNKVKLVCERYSLKYNKSVHEKTVEYNIKKWKNLEIWKRDRKGSNIKKVS
jgi:predicted transcriptional regulator